MNAHPSGLVLELKCLLDGPPEQIFRMMTEPTEVARWWGPDGFSTPEIELDLKVGGGYRFAMQPPVGELFHVSGEFLEIDAPGRFVYTFRWEEPDPDDRETVVILTFDAVGAATDVSFAGRVCDRGPTRAAPERLDGRLREAARARRIRLVATPLLRLLDRRIPASADRPALCLMSHLCEYAGFEVNRPRTLAGSFPNHGVVLISEAPCDTPALSSG